MLSFLSSDAMGVIVVEVMTAVAVVLMLMYVLFALNVFSKK
jgi:hypothetical protein